MTFTDDPATVKLSAASLVWQVLANMVGAAVVCAVIYGRLVALETITSSHTEELRVSRDERRELRNEFLGEVRQLRIDLANPHK